MTSEQEWMSRADTLPPNVELSGGLDTRLGFLIAEPGRVAGL